jgi:hypothetical protein
MSVTSSERRSSDPSWSSSGHISGKSYDFRFLISIAIVAIGAVVAILALAGHQGVNPDALTTIGFPP